MSVPGARSVTTVRLIAGRELRSLILSGAGGVVGAIWLVLSGYLFSQSVVGTGEATLTPWANDVQVFLLPLAAALAMGTLASEQRSGTIDLWLSSPVRVWQLVTGKYLGTLAFFAVLLALTAPYVLVLTWWADPPAGPMIGAYIGVFLFGASALAVGVFASATTTSQIVAAFGGVAILTVFYYLDSLSEFLGGAGAERILFWGSLTPHLEAFMFGSLSLRDGVYYVSFAAFWVAAAAFVLRRRL